MAQSSAFKTYDAVSNPEDLLPIISNISPTDTYLFTNLEKVKATNRTHEWTTDSLAAAAANTNIEGADYSFSLPAAKTRVTSYTQIFVQTLEVSDTQRVIGEAGIEDEFVYQMDKKLKEQARDIEQTLMTGTGNSGASGTARTLKGVYSFITTNVETGTGTGNETLTEDMYNNLLQTVFAQGGNPNVTLANAWQKRKISAFSSEVQRYIEAQEKQQIHTISIYESDFGRQEIVLHRWSDTDKVCVLEKDKWRVAVLRPTKQEEVAKVADSTRGAIVTELTLESLNEKASGKITQLATS